MVTRCSHVNPHHGNPPVSAAAALLGFALPLFAASAAAWGQAADRTVFVAHNGNLEGSVVSYRIHPDGTLAYVMKFVTGVRPNTSTAEPGCNAYEISLSPSGRYVATCHASGSAGPEQVTILQVAANATLSLIGEYPMDDAPLDLQWLSEDLLAVQRTDSAGGLNQVRVYAFNSTTGTLSLVDVKPTGQFSAYLALHPSAAFLYTQDTAGLPYDVTAWTIGDSGTLFFIEAQQTGSTYPLEMAISRDGNKLYAACGISNGGNKVLGFRIGHDGALTPLDGSPYVSPGASPSNVYVSDDNRLLFVGHGTDATVRSFRIDPQNGALTYTGFMFDVGLQGTVGDVCVSRHLLLVTDNSSAIDGLTGIYSFAIHADGSFVANGPIYGTTGVAPKALAVWTPPRQAGDLNCDGIVDSADLPLFVLALVDPDAYISDWSGCDVLLADFNADAAADGADIPGFLAALFP